jgi:hypothetical protein
VPLDGRCFALLLHDGRNLLVAGLSGLLAWQWPFVEALWVSDAWRGREHAASGGPGPAVSLTSLVAVSAAMVLQIKDRGIVGGHLVETALQRPWLAPA